MSSLYQLKADYQKLAALLSEEETDDSAIKDTLDAISDAIEEKCESIACVMQDLQGDIDKIDSEIKRLQARKADFVKHKADLQSYIFSAMQAADKRKFKTELFNFSICKAGARALVIDCDAADLPDEFKKVTVAADNAAIKAAMKAHGVEKIEGVGYLAPQTEYLKIK